MQWHSTSFCGSNTPISERIDGAINFMNRLMEANPAFKSAYPLAELSLKEGIELGNDYLAHEYFNADWEPMSVKKVNDILADCKIQFAASATHLELLPNICFSQEQLELIQSIKDPIFKEYTKDICLNQSFRRDLWVKGGQHLSDAEKMKEFLSISVTLLTPSKDITLDVKTPLGTANLNKDVYQPVFECLKGKSSIKLGEVARKLQGNINVNQLLEACIVLASKKVLGVAQDVDYTTSSYSDSLNKFIIDRSVYERKIGFLISPITSTGIPVTRFNQLFLRVCNGTKRDPKNLAETVWQMLRLQGEKIISDGKVLETDRENLQYLTNLANEFVDNLLPELIRLKIT
jgi:hypothetical protein